MTAFKGWAIGSGETTGEVFLTCPRCRTELMMNVSVDRQVSELVQWIDRHNRSCSWREHSPAELAALAKTDAT